MALPDLPKIKTDITNLQTFWGQRNKKFNDWYELLTLIDNLSTKGLESYVSNEPQTFYNMAHYLLTRGELSHGIPIPSESALDLDKRARVHRGCEYNWLTIDRDRQMGGQMPFLDELGHYLLSLGWYSLIYYFDKETGLLRTQIWNPYDTYPRFADGKLVACVHSYKVPMEEAIIKADANEGWNYVPPANPTGEVMIDDYWRFEDGVPYNIVLIGGKPVHEWVDRPEMEVLVSPVGGFPNKGSLGKKKANWTRLTGRSIFEVNQKVFDSFNKWKTMVSQILRDTAQPIIQEFSSEEKATPEQVRERGGLFHYSPTDRGLERVPPAAIPIEIQAHLMEMRRELMKGGFNDAVYGMMEGESGYALSALASSSANQILYPFMDAKHFVIAEGDRFWLSNLKSTKRVFEIKGKFVEKLHPTDIPPDVSVIVESDVATPKDMLERGTVAQYYSDFMDKATILKEIMKVNDPQAILRKKDLDEILHSPMAMMVKQIAGFRAHGKYLQLRGDHAQAMLFMKAADALEAQMGAPAPGQGNPADMGRIEQARAAPGQARKIPRTRAGVAPPEATQAFTPQQMRQMIGRGSIRK